MIDRAKLSIPTTVLGVVAYAALQELGYGSPEALFFVSIAIITLWIAFEVATGQFNWWGHLPFMGLALGALMRVFDLPIATSIIALGLGIASWFYFGWRSVRHLPFEPRNVAR